jgi:hypothetical protein
MGPLRRQLRKRFEEQKPAALAADVRMISGCEDSQTSADGTYVCLMMLLISSSCRYV